MEIIKKSSILVSQSLSSKEEATSLSGILLVENGYVEDGYVESMLEKL
jgi:PTS system mannitol-specific IIA component